MTDFLEEALADIDSVFFQEFVEQHKIDGKPFDVVPYEMTLKISIHALREEGDGKNREKTLCFCLIIHLPAQIAKRCLQTKPQNHTVTCANGWYSGAKRPGKPCVLLVRTGRTSKDQHAVLGKLRV